MARIYVLCLIYIGISCGGLPVNHEYRYAPDHDYVKKDYSFSYGVKDPHTGDIKNQWEKKTGDQVRGHYSLVEPDGTLRIVDYTVDGKSGFNAVVKHKGTSYHPSKKPTSYNEVLVKNRQKLEEISAILNQPKGELYGLNYSHFLIKDSEEQGDDKAIPSNHKSVYSELPAEYALDSVDDVSNAYLKDTIVTDLGKSKETGENKGSEYYALSETKGSKYYPSSENKGSEYYPLSENKESKYYPPSEHKGSEYYPHNENKGSKYYPPSEHKESEFYPHNENKGSKYYPPSEHKGSEYYSHSGNKGSEYYSPSGNKGEVEKKLIYFLPEESEKVGEKKPGEEFKYYYYAEEANPDKQNSKPYYFSGETLPEYYKQHGITNKPKYTKQSIQENLKPLPIDLSLLNPTFSGKDVAFEVDHLKPVVIDLNSSSGGGFKTPLIENGFKPVTQKHPDDNTYVSNIQPKTTPGLINYLGGYHATTKPLPVYKGASNKGPVQFPNNGNGGRGKTRRNPGGQNHAALRRPKVTKLVTYYHK